MRKKIILTSMLFALATFIGFPQSVISQPKTGEPIVLGVATPYSVQVEADNCLKAARMAMEEINAKGGVSLNGVMHPFKLVQEDTRDILPGIPVAEALLAVERVMLEKKAQVIVVGPSRSEAFIAAMDLSAKHKVPMIATLPMSPIIAKKISENYEKYKYVFRVGIDSITYGKFNVSILDYFNAKYGLNKAYFMAQDVLWARASVNAMEAALKKRKWEITGKEFFPTAATGDFSISLSKAKRSGTQVIIPIFESPQAGVLSKQKIAMNIPALLIGVIIPVVSPKAWEVFEGKVEGFILPVHEAGNIPCKAVPKSMEFYNAFQKRWGYELEAQHGASGAYESVYTVADAIERAGSVDPDALVSALEKTDRSGAIGRIRFNKSHEVPYGSNPQETALHVAFQWQKPGKRVIVFPQGLAEGKVQLPPELAGATK